MKPSYYVAVGVLFVLLAMALARAATACPAATPDLGPLRPGYGMWQQADCQWVAAPCAAPWEFSPGLTVRLPIGCPVVGPRIGYTLRQDTELREDLARASVEIPGLKDEVRHCRESADATELQSTKTLLTLSATCNAVKEANRQLKDENAALREAALWSQFKWSAVVVLAAGLGYLAGNNL